MGRSAKQSVDKRIPALVFIKTDETIIVDGKKYTVVKMMYDLKGEYMPLAPPIY